MKLQPGEQSILAFFHQGPAAESATESLRQAGIPEVQLDRVSPYGFDPEYDRSRPGRGDERSQVTATLYGNEQPLGNDTRVLLAAMPEVSGMAGPLIQEPPFLVTVVTSADRVDEAVAILKQHGGRV